MWPPLSWTNSLFHFRRSAFDQILAARWSCSVYTVLKIMRLFNTARIWSRLAKLSQTTQSQRCGGDCFQEAPSWGARNQCFSTFRYAIVWAGPRQGRKKVDLRLTEE